MGEAPKQAVAYNTKTRDLSSLVKTNAAAAASERASSVLWAAAAPASFEAVATGLIADDTEFGECGDVRALLARIHASESMAVDMKGNSSKLMDKLHSTQTS